MTTKDDNNSPQQGAEGDEAGEDKSTAEGMLEAVNSYLDGDGNDEGTNDESADTGQSSGEEAPAGSVAPGDEGGKKEAGEKDGQVSEDPKGDDKAQGQGQQQAAAESADLVNDPIPDEIKGKTRERMQSLIDLNKESDTKYSQLKQERDDLVGQIRDTGVKPDDFLDTLETLRLVNSTDQADRKKGLEILRKQADDLAIELGETPNDDVLTKHQDLQQQIADGEISKKIALEVATNRERAARMEQRSKQQNDQRAQAQQRQQLIEKGKADINAVEQEFLKDKDYAAKRQIVIPILKKRLPNVHPSNWGSYFRDLWEVTQVPASNGAAQQAGRSGPPEGDPTPGRGPSGSPAAAPESMLEAMDQGIRQARS